MNVLGRSRRPRPQPGPRRRIGTALAGLALGLTLTACTAPLPEVTFYADRAAIATAPTRWCILDAAAQDVSCTGQDSPRLRVDRGQPVQINVPGDVADQPWLIYFTYRDAAGEQWNGRSQIFTDGRLAYTLHPLSADDQLLSVEVLSGFELTAALTSGVDFTSTQGWELVIDPADGTAPASTDTPAGSGPSLSN